MCACVMHIADPRARHISKVHVMNECLYAHYGVETEQEQNVQYLGGILCGHGSRLVNLRLTLQRLLLLLLLLHHSSCLSSCKLTLERQPHLLPPAQFAAGLLGIVHVCHMSNWRSSRWSRVSHHRSC